MLPWKQLERKANRNVCTQESRLKLENERLKERLVKRDHVIAEISEEHVRQKKELEEP